MLVVSQHNGDPLCHPYAGSPSSVSINQPQKCVLLEFQVVNELCV